MGKPDRRLGAKILYFDIDAKLHTRATTVSKTLKMTLSGLAREALLYRVEHYEYKLYQQDLIVGHEEELKVMRTRKRVLTLEEKRVLKAQKKELAKAGAEAEAVDEIIDTDPLTPLYREHARLIANATDIREMRRRAEDAVTAVKLAQPLTHPPEGDILARLETHIIEARRTSIYAGVPDAKTTNGENTNSFESFLKRMGAPPPPPQLSPPQPPTE